MQNKTLSIPADLAHSAAVRDAVREFFALVGFGPVWINRLVLVTDELFMNAVKYGSKAGDQVQIILENDLQRVRVAISDCGAKKVSAADLQKIIDHHDTTMHAQKTNGRGLAVITSSWTDSFTVNENPKAGLTIAFEKRIEPDPTPNK